LGLREDWATINRRLTKAHEVRLPILVLVDALGAASVQIIASANWIRRISRWFFRANWATLFVKMPRRFKNGRRLASSGGIMSQSKSRLDARLDDSAMAGPRRHGEREGGGVDATGLLPLACSA
jgi:hypothetical protein